MPRAWPPACRTRAPRRDHGRRLPMPTLALALSTSDPHRRRARRPNCRSAQRWRRTLLASAVMTSREPLPFDPILRAAALWDERIGPSRTMAAVTSVMRVQQILLSAVDGALRPHGLTFARYEALVLLSFSRHGRLPMRVMGDRLQLHP